LIETPGKGLSAARALVRGQGIVDLYDYYRARKANDMNNELHYIDSEELNKLLIDSKDKPKEIANFALNHNGDDNKNQIAVKALKSFVKIYSEKTRDVAYTFLPYGGLYIVGNIAVNILTKAPYDELFSETFSNDDLLKDLPVYVVLDSEIGVQGAENCAFKLALN
jgi:glucokinase